MTVGFDLPNEFVGGFRYGEMYYYVGVQLSYFVVL